MSRAFLSVESLGTFLAKEALLRHHHDPVKILVDLYLGPGGEANYIGEAVSQREHAVQAAQSAREDGFDDDTVIAALLHDVGHLLEDAPQMDYNLGSKDHERLGGSFLRTLGFSDKTCQLVQRHVDAKRYLCCTMPEYYSRLSEASKGTLLQQGGPMNKQEADQFEKDPLHKTIVAMRTFDERAKVVDMANLKPFGEYQEMMYKSLQRKRAKELYERDGFVVLKHALSPQVKGQVAEWADQVQNWDQSEKGKWMVYYERDKNGQDVLCRTENILPYHEGFRSLLTEGEVKLITDELLGEESALYKEKINYKLPGGNGFPAHQDAPAFTTFGQKNHITVNVALDAATIENGCLEVAVGQHNCGLFPQNPEHGGLSDEAEAKLTWTPVPLEPGDVLMFSSWIPHRSKQNTSSRSRRALYVTYNAKQDGDFRDQYYIDKRNLFPPKAEREPGKDYSEGARLYNLATPITN